MYSLFIYIFFFLHYLHYLGKYPAVVLPKLVYLKFAELEQLILYLMHFNCAEVVLTKDILKYI